MAKPHVFQREFSRSNLTGIGAKIQAVLIASVLLFSVIPALVFIVQDHHENWIEKDNIKEQDEPVVWDFNLYSTEGGYKAETPGYDAFFTTDSSSYHEYSIEDYQLRFRLNAIEYEYCDRIDVEHPNLDTERVQGQSIKYCNNKHDLSYSLSLTSIKETITINNPPKGELKELRFIYFSEHNILNINPIVENNEIYLCDIEGNVYFKVSEMICYDSSLNGDQYVATPNILRNSNSEIIFEYIITGSYLQSVTYPLVCDPYWSSPIIDEQSESDKTIVQDGDLTIANGGTLNLDNVELRMEEHNDQMSTITVEVGGTFNVYKSKITAPDPQEPYGFDCTGDLRIVNSQVEHCNEGIVAYANSNVQILESKVSDSHNHGVKIVDSDVFIANTEISDNSGDGIYIKADTVSPKPIITETLVHDNGGNGIRAQPAPSSSEHPEVSIARSTIYSNSAKGVYLKDNVDSIISVSTIHTNVNEGLVVDLGSGIEILDSILKDNGPIGIKAINCEVTIKDCDISNEVLGISGSSMSGTIESSVIQSCTNGLSLSSSTNSITDVAVSDTTSVGISLDTSDLSFESCSVDGSGSNDISLTDSDIILKDSYYPHSKAQLDATSSMTVKWSLDITTLGDDNLPKSGITVTCDDVSSNNEFSSTSDSDGRIPVQYITEYIRDGLGVVYKTPHSIDTGFNAVDIHLSGPRVMSLYHGNDMDGDRIDDDKEGQYILSFEAEDHVLSYDQVHYISPGKGYVQADDNGKLTDPDTFYSVQSGDYYLLVRAASNDNGGEVSIDLKVNDVPIVSEDIEVEVPTFQWYQTSPFTCAGGSMKIQIDDTSVVDTYVMLDRIVLVKYKDASGPLVVPGQITIPLNRDSDDDGLPDGVELRDGQMWYEAEEYDNGGWDYSNRIHDEGLSGSTGSYHMDGSSEILDESKFIYSIDKGTYVVRTRAYSYSSSSTDMEVVVKYGTNQQTKEFSIGEDPEFYTTDSFAVTSDGTSFSVQVNDLISPLTNDPYVVVDAIMVERIQEGGPTDTGNRDLEATIGAACPAMSDGIIVQPCVDKVVAIEGQSQIWYDTYSGTPTSAVIEQEKVFFAVGDYLYGYELASGIFLWTNPIDLADGVFAPVVQRNNVLSLTLDSAGTAGTLYAINIEDGTTDWSVNLPDPPQYPPMAVGNLVYVVCEGSSSDVMYIVDCDGNFRSSSHGDDHFDIHVEESGSPISIDVMAPPASADGMVFISVQKKSASSNNYLVAVNGVPLDQPSQLDTLWQSVLISNPILKPPVIYDNKVICIDSGRNIRYFTEDTGTISHTDDDYTSYTSSTGMSLVETRLVLGFDNRLVCIDLTQATPDEIWYLDVQDDEDIDVDLANTVLIGDRDSDGFFELICPTVDDHIHYIEGGLGCDRDGVAWPSDCGDSGRTGAYRPNSVYRQSSPMSSDTDMDGMVECLEEDFHKYQRIEFEDYYQKDSTTHDFNYPYQKEVSGELSGGVIKTQWIRMESMNMEPGLYRTETGGMISIIISSDIDTPPLSVQSALGMIPDDFNRLPIIRYSRYDVSGGNPWVVPLFENKQIYSCYVEQDPLEVYKDVIILRWSYEGVHYLSTGNHYLEFTLDEETIALFMSYLPSYVNGYQITLVGDYVTLSKQGLDPLNADCDSDGLFDGLEHAKGTYPWNSDPDEDGLGDVLELEHGTSPDDRDSDHDLIRDRVELGIDTDDTTTIYDTTNSKTSWMERRAVSTDPSIPVLLTNTDADTSTKTSPIDPDTDGDGSPDGWIDGWSYRTWNSDTEWSMVSNSYDWGPYAEANLMLITDSWEFEDINIDGLKAPTETNPNEFDSDGDFMPDGWESFYQIDPLDINSPNGQWDDPDGDSSPNIREYASMTDPTESDTDQDTLGDLEETEKVMFRTNIDEAMFSFEAYDECTVNDCIRWGNDIYRYSQTVVYPDTFTRAEIDVNPWVNPGVSQSTSPVAMLPDGTWILFNSEYEELYIWSPESIRFDTAMDEAFIDNTNGKLVVFEKKNYDFYDHFLEDNVMGMGGSDYWTWTTEPATFYHVAGGLFDIMGTGFVQDYGTLRHDIVIGIDWEMNFWWQLNIPPMTDGDVHLEISFDDQFVLTSYMLGGQCHWEVLDQNQQVVSAGISSSQPMNGQNIDFLANPGVIDVLVDSQPVVMIPRTMNEDMISISMESGASGMYDYVRYKEPMGGPVVFEDEFDVDNVIGMGGADYWLWTTPPQTHYYIDSSQIEVTGIPDPEGYGRIEHHLTMSDDWKVTMEWRLTQNPFNQGDPHFMVSFNDQYSIVNLINAQFESEWQVYDQDVLIWSGIDDSFPWDELELLFKTNDLWNTIDVYINDDLVTTMPWSHNEYKISIAFISGSSGVIDLVTYRNLVNRPPAYTYPVYSYRGQEIYYSDPFLSDSDFDGIKDSLEYNALDLDYDDDGISDRRDLDSDDDTLTDWSEDSNRNGQVEFGDDETDPYGEDTDGDGIDDGDDDHPLDQDNDGLTGFDAHGTTPRFGGQEDIFSTQIDNSDSDNDELLDGEEVFRYGTDPNDNDTDGDGLLDGEEIDEGTNPHAVDTDWDGLWDGIELSPSNGYITDPLNPDTDGGGVSDSVEIGSNLDPTDPTDDHDHNDDENDEDGDTVPRRYEDENGLSDTDSSDIFENKDDDAIELYSQRGMKEVSLSNYDEYRHSTLANEKDTDGDTMPDVYEVYYGLNPNGDDSDFDSDGDGVINKVEFTSRTNPFSQDTDRDGIKDKKEIDDTFLSPTDWDSDYDMIPDGIDHSPKTYQLTNGNELNLNLDLMDSTQIPNHKETDDPFAGISVVMIYDGDSPTMEEPKIRIIEETVSTTWIPTFHVYTDNPVSSFTAYIKIQYKQNLIPEGYSEETLVPFYRSENKHQWKPFAISGSGLSDSYGIDRANNFIWIKTNHFCMIDVDPGENADTDNLRNSLELEKDEYWFDPGYEDQASYPVSNVEGWWSYNQVSWRSQCEIQIDDIAKKHGTAYAEDACAANWEVVDNLKNHDTSVTTDTPIAISSTSKSWYHHRTSVTPVYTAGYPISFLAGKIIPDGLYQWFCYAKVVKMPTASDTEIQFVTKVHGERGSLYSRGIGSVSEGEDVYEFVRDIYGIQEELDIDGQWRWFSSPVFKPKAFLHTYDDEEPPRYITRYYTDVNYQIVVTTIGKPSTHPDVETPPRAVMKYAFLARVDGKDGAASSREFTYWNDDDTDDDGTRDGFEHNHNKVFWLEGEDICHEWDVLTESEALKDRVVSIPDLDASMGKTGYLGRGEGSETVLYFFFGKPKIYNQLEADHIDFLNMLKKTGTKSILISDGVRNIDYLQYLRIKTDKKVTLRYTKVEVNPNLDSTDWNYVNGELIVKPTKDDNGALEYQWKELMKFTMPGNAIVRTIIWIASPASNNHDGNENSMIIDVCIDKLVIYPDSTIPDFEQNYYLVPRDPLYDDSGWPYGGEGDIKGQIYFDDDALGGHIATEWTKKPYREYGGSKRAYYMGDTAIFDCNLQVHGNTGLIYSYSVGIYHPTRDRDDFIGYLINPTTKTYNDEANTEVDVPTFTFEPVSGNHGFWHVKLYMHTSWNEEDWWDSRYVYKDLELEVDEPVITGITTKSASIGYSIDPLTTDEFTSDSKVYCITPYQYKLRYYNQDWASLNAMELDERLNKWWNYHYQVKDFEIHPLLEPYGIIQKTQSIAPDGTISWPELQPNTNYYLLFIVELKDYYTGDNKRYYFEKEDYWFSWMTMFNTGPVNGFTDFPLNKVDTYWRSNSAWNEGQHESDQCTIKYGGPITHNYFKVRGFWTLHASARPDGEDLVWNSIYYVVRPGSTTIGQNSYDGVFRWENDDREILPMNGFLVTIDFEDLTIKQGGKSWSNSVGTIKAPIGGQAVDIAINMRDSDSHAEATYQFDITFAISYLGDEGDASDYLDNGGADPPTDVKTFSIEASQDIFNKDGRLVIPIDTSSLPMEWVPDHYYSLACVIYAHAEMENCNDFKPFGEGAYGCSEFDYKPSKIQSNWKLQSIRFIYSNEPPL